MIVRTGGGVAATFETDPGISFFPDAVASIA